MKHSPGFLKIVEDSLKRVREITIDDVLKWRKEGAAFHFIDVREESEWAAGRAQGSIHLGKGVIERDIETVVTNTNDTVVLYCGGGFRSALAGDALQKMGYQNVYSMTGGIRAWREKQLPEDR